MKFRVYRITKQYASDCGHEHDAYVLGIKLEELATTALVLLIILKAILWHATFRFIANFLQ